MKKCKKIISLLTSLLMIASVSASVSADAVVKSSFDDVTIESAPEEQTTGSYTSGTTSFWLNTQLGQTFNTVDAPAPDGKMNSYTAEDGVDKAVQIKIAPYTVDETATNPSGTPFMSTNSLAGDLYDKGSVCFSFNVYASTVKNATHVPLRVEFRNSANTSVISTLVDFRSGGNLRFSDSSSYQKTYSTGKWYNVKLDIDTKAKTYKAYIDGVQLGTTAIPMANQANVCFGGDPAADSLVTLNQLRITTNNAKNVTSGSSQIYFDDVYLGDVFSTSVEEISLDSFTVSDGENEVDEVVYTEDALTASATFTYSEKTEELPVAIYGAVYGSDKMLKKVYAVNDTVPTATIAGDYEKTVSLPMSFLGENALADGDNIKVYLWNGSTMLSLAENKNINVTDGKNYKANINFEKGTNLSDYKITLGNAGSVMTADVVNDDLTGLQKNALKIVAKNVPSSGLPYITITPEEGLKDKVYIDYKLYCADNGSSTHPRIMSVNGKSNLLEYRPTKAINYYPSGSAAASGQNFARWSWDNYHIEIDFNAGTYTASINNNEIGTGKVSETNLSNLRFTIGHNKNYTSGSSTTYIDDIKVYVD